MNWSNKNEVLEAVKQNGMNLKNAHYSLKADKDVVSEATNETPNALEFAHYSFKDDKEFVLNLIEKHRDDNLILSDVSPRLKDDEEVVNKCIESELGNARYASLRLQNKQYLLSNKKDFLQRLRTLDEHEFERSFDSSYYNVDYRLLDDKELMLEFVEKYPAKLKEVSDRLKDDEDVVLKSVKKYAWTIKFASERLRDSEKVVKEAMRLQGFFALPLSYASDRLKNDEKFIREITEMRKEIHNDILEVCSERLQEKIGWVEEQEEMYDAFM